MVLSKHPVDVDEEASVSPQPTSLELCLVIHLGSVVILLLSSNWQQIVFIHRSSQQLTHIMVVNQEDPAGGAELLVFWKQTKY